MILQNAAVSNSWMDFFGNLASCLALSSLSVEILLNCKWFIALQFPDCCNRAFFFLGVGNFAFALLLIEDRRKCRLSRVIA